MGERGGNGPCQTGRRLGGVWAAFWAVFHRNSQILVGTSALERHSPRPSLMSRVDSNPLKSIGSGGEEGIRTLDTVSRILP